jgi:UDP-N-acetylmuramoylalanine--D-glutamate ligase
MHAIAGKRVTVFGLGRFGGGIAVTKWLIEQGATVLVTDQDGEPKLRDSVAQLSGLPVEFALGQLRESDFTQSDLIVASPAVPPANPFLAAARAAGVPITTEICLFVDRCRAQTFAVTGTKGKSTTTAMLGAMLSQRFVAHVGGNIGVSLLAKIPQIKETDVVVLELSSYMLQYLGEMRWSPHVAVVTLLGADHLEWHGSLEAYQDAKKNLIRFQKPTDFVVLSAEDSGAAGLAAEAVGGVVLYKVDGSREFALNIPGRHNQLNAQGAFAAAKLAGVTWEQAQELLRKFPGLPHRLELVHTAGGVRWYNDSIATIPDAAVAALNSFPAGKVIQIIGGKDKHLPIESMCRALLERGKAILCIGVTGPMVAGQLEAMRQGNAPAVHQCGELSIAVDLAHKIAVEGDIVLLSPAFPSYDQFVNFEMRGQAFVKLARGE